MQLSYTTGGVTISAALAEELPVYLLTKVVAEDPELIVLVGVNLKLKKAN